MSGALLNKIAFLPQWVYAQADILFPTLVEPDMSPNLHNNTKKQNCKRAQFSSKKSSERARKQPAIEQERSLAQMVRQAVAPEEARSKPCNQNATAKQGSRLYGASHIQV